MASQIDAAENVDIEYEIRNYTPKELNLIQHNLTIMPSHIIEFFASTCEYLDLSQNRLKDLKWIYEFAALQYLILDSNRLSEINLQRLQHPLPNIKVLMLNKNEFSDLGRTIKEIQRLFPNLEYLSLHGNPICPDHLELKPFCHCLNYDYEQYKSYIACSLSQLKFLDHGEVHKNVITTVATTTDKQNSYIQKLWTRFKGLITTTSTADSSTSTRRHSINCASAQVIILENISTNNKKEIRF